GGGRAGGAERVAGGIRPGGDVGVGAVHVERNELRQAHGELKRAEGALRLYPDRLTGTVACLVVARKALAEGHPDGAVETVRKARHGGPLPYWVARRPGMPGPRARAAAGGPPAAPRAAEP